MNKEMRSEPGERQSRSEAAASTTGRGVSRMKMMQQQAEQDLRTSFTPPQRYGTAFHITPPYLDVRLLPLKKFKGATSAPTLALTVAEAAILQEYLAGDAYGLWHAVNHQQLPTSSIRVAAGTTQTLESEYTGWSSQLRIIIVEAGATLTLTDHINDSAFAVHRQLIVQHADSQVTFWGVRHAVDFLNESMAVYLTGSGAQIKVSHLGVVGRRDQVDCQVKVFHQAPQTTSNITARFAATDHGLAMYRGLIDVSRQARGTQGYQQGKALILSPTAIVDFLPELAINTNDVKCSHGVTTTHLDDTTLFYLRSRGLPVTHARQLATRGFFHHGLTIPAKLATVLEGIIDTQIDHHA